jgi:hypothetical protein
MDEVRNAFIGAGTNQLPCLIDKNCLPLRAVLLNSGPQEVHHYEHSDALEIARKVLEVEDNKLVV